MAEQPTDQNGRAISAARVVGSATNTTDTTYAVPAGTTVLRIASTAGCTYGVDVAASVLLPAGAIEYIGVRGGETVNVTGTANFVPL